MTKTLLRGRVLSFHADPAETADSHRFWENGAILVEDGRILAVGDYADTRDPEAREIDHRPHIIMAGFIDPHIHFPQVQVVAAWAAQLRLSLPLGPSLVHDVKAGAAEMKLHEARRGDPPAPGPVRIALSPDARPTLFPAGEAA